MTRVSVALLALLLPLAGSHSNPTFAAESYPTKAIRLIVPFPPGGPADLLARIVGEKLSATFVQRSATSGDSRR